MLKLYFTKKVRWSDSPTENQDTVSYSLLCRTNLMVYKQSWVMYDRVSMEMTLWVCMCRSWYDNITASSAHRTVNSVNFELDLHSTLVVVRMRCRHEPWGEMRNSMEAYDNELWTWENWIQRWRVRSTYAHLITVLAMKIMSPLQRLSVCRLKGHRKPSQ